MTPARRSQVPFGRRFFAGSTATQFWLSSSRSVQFRPIPGKFQRASYLRCSAHALLILALSRA
jgi:hypothetical protein